MDRMVKRKNDKKFLIVFGAVFAISLICFIAIFVSINNKFKANSDLGLVTINTTESIVPNENYNSVSVSSSKDKSINEVKNTVKNQIASGKSLNVSSSSKSSQNTVLNSEPKKFQNTVNQKVNSSVIDEPEKKQELSFIAPCSGEIIKDYASDNLVYSKTLDEWTTHLGIDIKANKTGSVVASERGTVKSIKTDPRYGLTVIISHDDGYETLYANLLSADFVKEGDKVVQNQTIGTVGESASFEVLDEPHLHFEVIKNGENINPTTVLKK